MPFPVIVKPNYEGSSKGIGDESVARDRAGAARASSSSALEQLPGRRLVEEFIPGTDVTVRLRRGLGDDGVLDPGRVRRSIRVARSKYNIYDYQLKNIEAGAGAACAARPSCRATCSARIKRDLARRSCARSACATSAASTSGSATTAASTSSRSTRCPSLEPGASALRRGQARRGCRLRRRPSRAIVKSAALRRGLHRARGAAPQQEAAPSSCASASPST